MTLDLEDRLWEQLESAADREASRGRAARATAAARAALPAWRLHVVAVGVAAAVAAVVIVVALTPERAERQWRIERVGVSGGRLSAGVTAHGALWSYDQRSGAVLRLDPRTHRVLARVTLPHSPTDAALASGAGAVWAIPSAPIVHSTPAPIDPAPAELVRIDPRTNRVTARVLLRAPDGSTLLPVGVVALRDAVWVWGERGALRVDPHANQVRAVIRPGGDLMKGFAATGTRVSFLTDLGRLVTVDALSGDRLGVVPIDAPIGSNRLVHIGDAVVVYQRGGVLASIDPLTGRRHWTVRLAGRPRDLATAGGRLWLLITEPGAKASELRALDPGDGHVVARLMLPADDGTTIAPATGAPVVTTQSGDMITVHPPR